VWRRDIDGKVLTFHLAGINNQNFLMRDEQTGSVWQQISGQAIFGPLKGRTLTRFHSDELSFAEWKAEQPAGVVLAPVSAYAKHYVKQDWETEVAKYDTPNGSAHIEADRELMLGLETGGAARAFPLKSALEQKLVEDRVGSDAVLLVVAPDNLSVRAFENRIPSSGKSSDFYRNIASSGDDAHPDTNSGMLMTDAATQSTWNFHGCAVSGPLKGQCLQPLEVIKDYWFDWKAYHPQTSVYRH